MAKVRFSRDDEDEIRTWFGGFGVNGGVQGHRVGCLSEVCLIPTER